MRAMTLQLLRIPLARDTNNEPEIAIRAGFHPGKGILDDNRSFRLNPEETCRLQERVRSRFPFWLMPMLTISLRFIQAVVIVWRISSYFALDVMQSNIRTTRSWMP